MKIKFLGLLAVLVIQSCASKKDILYLQDAGSYNNTAINYTSATIQPNDILKITIGALVPEAAIPYNRISSTAFQTNSLEVMKLEGYLVSPELTIVFPVLGVLSVADKTTAELEKDLVQRIESGGHLIDPNVSVRLLNAKVTVLGEVNNPGTFNFTENSISLLQALGLARDLTINGKREDVVLIRETGGRRTITHLDLTSGNWMDSDYNFIMPNDVIIVNPNDAKVKSAGFIGNAGNILAIASLVLSSIILLTR